MPLRRLLLAATLVFASWAPSVHALTLNETGFTYVLVSGDLGKQVEIGFNGGVGGDTCLYYGTFDGLKRRCAYNDPETVCDATLTFPVGVAFGNGGSFGNYMYVADYGVMDVWRSVGCSPATHFATVPGPGSLAFPPAGSGYGDFLYTCQAFDGPIYRISSTGVVTSWLELESTYLKFGPGGVWGTQLYSTEGGDFGEARIVKISSTQVVTPVVGDFITPEGFDWGFDNDLFATDVVMGEIYRVKPNGTKTLFATLENAADVAFRPGEQALYVVSTSGGFYRITRSGGATGVGDAPRLALGLEVSPNPSRGHCTVSFTLPVGQVARAQVIDAQGRVVRRLADGWRPAGAHALEWDGRDESGARAPAGVYFARVLAGGESRSTRIALTN